MPTWQILTWSLIAVLFFYAVWQIVQAVHIGSRAKDAQRIARRNDTRRAASLTTPAADEPSPPAKKTHKSDKPRKENRLDFSAYLPPEDGASMQEAETPETSENSEAAEPPPRAPRRSFDEDLQAQIDLLSTYDQLSSQFDDADAGAGADADDAAPPVDGASEFMPDPLDDDPQTEPAPSQSSQPLISPRMDPTTPREADELVLFSGDGAPPTTLWSRSVPIPHAAALPTESAASPAEAAAPEETAGEAAPQPPQTAEGDGAPAEPFPLELELRQFRRELAQMRGTMAEQRQQSARLTEELNGQRALNNELHKEINELREQLSSLLTGQNISPEYSEPLMLAQRGMGVDELAEHCGISVAEAQLLCSLAASRRTAAQPGETHEPQ